MKTKRSLYLLFLTLALAGLMPLAAAAQSVTLVPAGSVWKYHDLGMNLGTAWIQPLYDDNSWVSGRAQLGYGEGDEATVVASGPMGSHYVTTYFRHAFMVTNAASCTNLTLRLLRDDGAVVYLNGVELVRVGMPAGQVIYSTYAANAATEGSLFVTPLLNSLILVDGMNVVAVEIHQNSPSSSDISFDLELVNGEPVAMASFLDVPTNAVFAAPANLSLTAKATAQAGVTGVKFYVNGTMAESKSMYSRLYATFNRQLTTASNYSLAVSAQDNSGLSRTSTVQIVVEPAPAESTVLAGTGATWKYLDDGTDPGADWQKAGYNDAGWSNGPAVLGYGKPSLATTVRSTRLNGTPITTTFFRREWSLPNPAQFRKVAVRVLGDDGARVFLNGTEIFRNNLPSDPVSASTLALETMDPVAFTSGAYVDASLLAEGTNTLAAEVHQASSGAADLVFDLELVAFGDPALSIQLASPDSIVLSWPYPSTGYHLISTPGLAPADWSNVTNAPVQWGSELQVTVPRSEPGRFFRLMKTD